MSIEFLVTSLIVVVAPGIGVLYTMAVGLSRGARASVVAAFGCTLGILPHIVAAVTGLAAVLHASALAFQTLKYLGVIYLFYMAWQMWRDTGAAARRDAGSAAPTRRRTSRGTRRPPPGSYSSQRRPPLSSRRTRGIWR